MRVRQRKAPSAKQMAQVDPVPVAEPKRLPAPIRGWILNESLANPQPGGARQLDNFICGQTTIRVRKGTSQHARCGTGRVGSLFTYKTGSTETLFGASTTAIYDITSPADPDVTPTAAVSGQTSGDWYTQQFATSGGEFLYCVNGSDSPQLYDGSTWTTITGASSPAITGVTTSSLSHVWSFANRLFFVESGTQSAWYLPVDSIGGAAAEFPLAGVFRKGGALLFGATWSTDAGDGMNDQCVFVSTTGEVAIYRGTNPASAADWALVGVYEIEKPIGPKAIMRAGGDLLIATEVGLVPLSEAMRRDVAALSLGAVSRAIEPEWRTQAKTLVTHEWQIAKWPRENIMIVTQPEAAFSNGYCFVANMQTGAWSRFTGLNMQSIGVYNGNVYFGADSGEVYLMESGGQDGSSPYTCRYLGQAEPLDMPGVQKTLYQARPIFATNTGIVAQFGALTDYRTALPSAPNTSGASPDDGWDISTWDTSLWDAGAGSVTATDSRWVSIGATGYAHAPILQMTFGTANAPDVEYIGADITVQAGAVVA